MKALCVMVAGMGHGEGMQTVSIGWAAHNTTGKEPFGDLPAAIQTDGSGNSGSIDVYKRPKRMHAKMYFAGQERQGRSAGESDRKQFESGRRARGNGAGDGRREARRHTEQEVPQGDPPAVRKTAGASKDQNRILLSQ